MGDASLVGATLYASFSIDSCFKGCLNMAGLFRTTRGSDWETLVEGESTRMLATRDPDLFWVQGVATVDAKPIHHVRLDTLASSVAATIPANWGVFGIAMGVDSLFSLTGPTSGEATTLDRRVIAADGSLGDPEALLVIGGGAGGLFSNEQVLAWTESPGVLAVADFSGARRYVAALPDAQGGSASLSERYAYVAFEHGTGLEGTDLCELDLATGEARIIVARRPLVSICSVAANSTHVFWTQSSAPNVYCDQVWAKPVDGGTPRVLACNVGHSRLRPPEVLANDEIVYWIGSEVHALEARAL